MRKLPLPFAERLAARLKGQSGDSSGPQNPGQSQPSDQTSAGASNRPGGGDLQQLLGRMPAATLADLQKGDVVMVVTTQGTEKDSPAVITLLAGVDPILRASPKGGQDMILSPWTLGGGEPSAN